MEERTQALVRAQTIKEIEEGKGRIGGLVGVGPGVARVVEVRAIAYHPPPPASYSSSS